MELILYNKYKNMCIFLSTRHLLIYKCMKELNLCGVGDSELVKKVRRFAYNNQGSLPVSIRSNNPILVIMVLEDGDFRFSREGDLIIVTD